MGINALPLGILRGTWVLECLLPSATFAWGCFSSVLEAMGLGEAGSFVEECGKVASTRLGLLLVLVRGVVAVKTAGAVAEGIAEVSSSFVEL